MSSCNPTPGYTPGKKDMVQKDICTLVFIAALFTIASHGNNLNVHSQRIKTMLIYMVEYYAATKKNETLPLAEIWTDLEIVRLSEVSESDRKGDITCDVTYMRNPKRYT